MPTLREVITDVLANPEKYEGVFVTEREPVAEKYAYLNSPSAEFGGSTAEMFSETLRRVSDGLASAVQANSYNRPPRGLHYGAIDMPFYTSAGAMGYRSVPIQLEDGMAHLPALEIPSTEPSTATGVMIQQDTQRAAQWLSDLQIEADQQCRANDAHYDPATGRFLGGPVFPELHIPMGEISGDRPAHYRTAPGRCSCGFTSAFTGDINSHIAQ